jgi:prephenate dehydrogenase
MLGNKITIIGGSGGMGKVFGRFFQKHGFELTLFARDVEKLKEVAEQLHASFSLNLEECIKDADIVMITIPIISTVDMIKKVVPHMKENALIFDITSLKVAVFKTLKESFASYPINCISLHPMFGPGIKNMKNYVIIVLRVGGTSEYEQKIEDLLNLFKMDGLIITETTPEEHDIRMALTLGVPHMLNILFLNLLKRTGLPLNELTRYTGTTFLLQKVFAESIIQREMEMFGEIQMENNEFHKVLDIFEMLIKEYREIIQKKDVNAFNGLFLEGLKYSQKDNHFRNSYKYFYDFMKVLKKTE